MRRASSRLWFLLILVGLAAAPIAVRAWRARLATTVPTHEVRAGVFTDFVLMRGELKARSSIVLTAPLNAGELQILKLVPTGTAVRKGDVVVEFNALTLERTLQQKGVELKQAEAEIDRARAEARIREERGLTELAKARYDVERARLEASKQEILSEIEGAKNRILLDNAEQRLSETGSRHESERIAAQAEIDSKKRQRDKIQFELEDVGRQIAALSLRAPIDGLITVLPNRRSQGQSSAVREFRPGDRCWSGVAIAELPDLNTLRVTGRVDEYDRGRMAPGQKTTIRVDAMPGRELTGWLEEISPLAKPDSSSWPVRKSFDVMIALAALDPQLLPGMSATVHIAVEHLAGAIVIPAQALSQRDGRSVVYLQRGRDFQERSVEVGRRGQDLVLIVRGLRPGDRIALESNAVAEGSGGNP